VVREKSRDIQYINILRVVAIYIVVTGHVAIWAADSTAPLSLEWWAAKWIHLIGLCSIPIFVMISGALLLDDSRTEPTWSFYRRRLYRIGIPLAFWTVLYLAVRRYIDNEQLTAGRVFELILTANPYYHLWFLCMIPGLYLVTPLLRIFVRNSTARDRILLIAVIFVLAGVYSPINNLVLGNRRTILTMFLPYMAYYLAGYEVRRIDPAKVPLRYLLVAAAICIAYVVAFAWPFIGRLGQSKTIANFQYDSFSPPQVVMGIGIFWFVYLLCQRTRPLRGIPKTAIEWMASTTLGIYVLHPLVLSYMRYRFSDESAEGGFLFTVTVGPLVGFIVSYLLASLIINIPVLRRTIS